VLGTVNRHIDPATIIVCAAGGLPGELHKLWRVKSPESYHMEYGYSCMGYEIAGGLGVKMANPHRPVLVIVGDGSYLMMNSEIATSVMLDKKLVIIVLDNRGFGCIDRLQRGTGYPGFNNLLEDTLHQDLPVIGAKSEYIGAKLDLLPEALSRAEKAEKTYVIVIDTDPRQSTQSGGHWWDVAIPEISTHEKVREARQNYEQRRKM
jgi:3D-(3,5/4)-trihydroxycyclohexane-1,2-dione acylhydrolase (decyclizing)